MIEQRQEEIRQRVLRLAVLRRAARAVAQVRLAPLFQDVEARAVRRSIEAVACGEADIERLRSVDATLDAMAAGIVGMLDETGFAQLRSTLPALIDASRDEVLALLDVVLDDLAGREKRLRLVEYLVTVLAADRVDGRWRMVHMPVELTAKLKRACERARSSCDPGQLPRVHEELGAAAVELQISSDLGDLLREMRGFKASLGGRILVPSVLQAVVSYNIDVWNRRAEQIEDDRTLQRLEEALTEAGDDPLTLSGVSFSDGIDFGPVVVPPTVETDPADGRGQDALLTAAQRLERDAAHDALAQRVADSVAALRHDKPLDPEIEALGAAGVMESLGAEERSALDQGPAAASHAEVVRLMVAAQLLLQADDEFLRDLGADPDYVRSKWLRRVNERIRTATNAAIAAGDLDAARQLADVKERRVGAAIAELLRQGRRRRLVEPIAPEDARAARLRGVLITFKEYKRSSLLLIALGLTLAALIGWRWSMSAGRTQDLLSPTELSLASEHLTSGYRDGPNADIFIGRVDRSFAKLPDVHRRREGWGMALELQRSFGVNEVLLYDEDLGVAFHSIGKEIRRPFEGETWETMDGGS